MGGAIYTNMEISFNNCQFANNTAENGAGNDIYTTSTSSFFGDASNYVNSCSLSISPGRVANIDGVFEFKFDNFKMRFNQLL
jgi:hypothetical protein